jgi:hypothetical protein
VGRKVISAVNTMNGNDQHRPAGLPAPRPEHSRFERCIVGWHTQIAWHGGDCATITRCRYLMHAHPDLTGSTRGTRAARSSNSIVASIRVGFFEDFKGADTLLLDVDPTRACKAFIAWLDAASSSAGRPPSITARGAGVQSGLHVNLSREPNDRELVRTAGKWWRRVQRSSSPLQKGR